MIIIFGGSFDPPHTGHNHIIQSLKKKYPIAKKIIIIPNKISPFKKDKSLQQEDLWNLCKLSFAELIDEQTLLSDIEIKNDDVSYTINTVKSIIAEYQNQKVFLCIGEDSLIGLIYWYNFKELDLLIEKYIIIRRDSPYPQAVNFPNKYLENKSVVLNNDLWEISSTRLKAERNLNLSKQWLDPKVVAYLEKINWFKNEIG
ncbi:MAG: adenylyltransferase/cytidyltransferase family protein [Leptospira sp.]|nr:adenylyltransferase/cytidyltransferase family protein [Leptospira sp.]